MPRIELNLNKADDLKKVKAQWRVGPGLVPGEPNEGLKAQLLNTPARLPDYETTRGGRSALTFARVSPSVLLSLGIASPLKYLDKLMAWH